MCQVADPVLQKAMRTNDRISLLGNHRHVEATPHCINGHLHADFGLAGCFYHDVNREPGCPMLRAPCQEIDGIIALDRLPGRLSDARVRYVIGDVANRQLSSLFDATVDGIFHLAAVVSGTAEADFALGGPQAGVELCERDHSRAARRCPGHMPCRAGYIIVAYLAMPADCFPSACL